MEIRWIQLFTVTSFRATSAGAATIAYYAIAAGNAFIRSQRTVLKIYGRITASHCMTSDTVAAEAIIGASTNAASDYRLIRCTNGRSQIAIACMHTVHIVSGCNVDSWSDRITQFGHRQRHQMIISCAVLMMAVMVLMVMLMLMEIMIVVGVANKCLERIERVSSSVDCAGATCVAGWRGRWRYAMMRRRQRRCIAATNFPDRCMQMAQRGIIVNVNRCDLVLLAVQQVHQFEAR